MTYIAETADMADTVPLRILVPLDGTPRSQQALPYAQSLAMSPTTIILLEVLPDPEPERGLRGNITLPAEVVGQRQAAAAGSTVAGVALRRSVARGGVVVGAAAVTPATTLTLERRRQEQADQCQRSGRGIEGSGRSTDDRARDDGRRCQRGERQDATHG